ncbi:MAG: hypothetical protein OSJ72_09990 [Lachnospiraceae bacterium]|nr:hypothetical protein [Lachnospiraceae bacterium]
MPELTKDADKVICCIYKEYLERRKSGMSKSQAKEFDGNFYRNVKTLSKWNSADVSDTLQELHNRELIKKNVIGDFTLLDSAISYMENRFKNGLSEVVDFISSLPLPF